MIEPPRAPLAKRIAGAIVGWTLVILIFPFVWAALWINDLLMIRYYRKYPREKFPHPRVPPAYRDHGDRPAG